MFKKLGLAITFSPNGKALVFEVKRLSDILEAEVVFIHNGEKTLETESKLLELINSAGFDNSRISIEWVKGNIVKSITKKAAEKNVDLLISGALEKENMLKHFIGSVARNLMNEAKSSVLILTSPSVTPKGFKNFYVSVEFTPESEKTIKSAFQFALKEKVEEFVLIKDFYVPALPFTMQEGVSVENFDKIRKQWQLEEEEKVRLLVNELNLHGLEVKIKCLYGKEGWESNNFVRTNNADIFAISAPKKKIGFIDRLFPHEVGYSFEKIPTNLLIIR